MMFSIVSMQKVVPWSYFSLLELVGITRGFIRATTVPERIFLAGRELSPNAITETVLYPSEL